MNKNLPTVGGIQIDKIEQLEKVSEAYGLLNMQKKGQFEQMFGLAEGIRQMNVLITDDMMERIMFLQDNKLGFRTDKMKDGGYAVNIVKQCFIEATLRGVRPIGNEWNIIAANLYITKEGYSYILQQYPGLTDYRQEIGVPKTEKGKAVTECEARWNLDGKPGHLKCVIPAKTDAYTSIDAIIGKTDRKLKYRVHCQLIGSMASEFDERDENEMLTNAPKSLVGASVVEAANKASQKNEPAVVDAEISVNPDAKEPPNFDEYMKGQK